MTTTPKNFFVCSTAGRVYALRTLDGSQVWESELDGVTKGVGSLFVFGDKRFGETHYRDGMKYKDISILVIPPSNSAQPSVVIVASYGKVHGISSESGETFWKSELKDSGYNLPSVMLDSSSPNKVLVGCGKQLYKINIRDGETIWQRTIYNGSGSPYVTMATHQSSLQAAFTHTGLNNNPIAK